MAEGEGRAWDPLAKKSQIVLQTLRSCYQEVVTWASQGCRRASPAVAETTKEQALKPVLTPRWEAADSGRDSTQNVEKRYHLS